MTLGKELWLRHGGDDIWLYTISNDNISLCLSNLGCTFVSLTVSKNNNSNNIILGYKTAEEYLQDKYYMGSIVGRFAGRIAGASLKIADHRYSLSPNDGATGNHLHGGLEGFNKKVFTVRKSFAGEDEAGIQFFYQSPHLEEGYPGNLSLQVSISLTKNDEIKIQYEAYTDRPTFLNLTHHCYFNLAGQGSGLQQELAVCAEQFLPLGYNYIPTGEILQAKNTRFDFTSSVGSRLSARVNEFTGYNDYLIFMHSPDKTPQMVLLDPASGIALAIRTSYPGVLLYTGDYLDAPFKKNQGICLETQLYPDSPNHPSFPSALLLPGEKYEHETVYTLRNIR